MAKHATGQLKSTGRFIFKAGNSVDIFVNRISQISTSFERSMRYRQITIILSVLIIVCGLWLFFEITEEVIEGEILSYDNRFLSLMRDSNGRPVGPDWLPKAMRNISSLGSTAVLLLIVGSVIGFLTLQRKYKSTLLVAAAAGIGVAWVILLKGFLSRPRPDVITHLVEVTTQSYPSGHTTMSSVIYLSLASILAQLQEQKRIKIYSIAIAMLLTFMVGISRIYLGVHYPSDVLAGWALGLSWASMCWVLFGYLNNRFVKEAE